MTKAMRPNLDKYFMQVAAVVASRSTCRHRKQGAVLVRDNRIIATGYNGAPPGATHCIDVGYCHKDKGLPCVAEGLHGESNAIVSAAVMGVSTVGSTLYSMFSPCMACCNLLKSAGITRAVYAVIYEGFPECPIYLGSLGIEVVEYAEIA